MTLLLIYAGIALGASFLCSILESVLLSVTPSYIGALQAEGSPVGDRLRGLRDDIDRSLASILSVNTIANTVGAVGVGAQAQIVWGDAYVAMISGILTLAILFMAEIIPKTLGATHWRRLAPVMALILPVLIILTLPLVFLAKKLMDVLSPHEAPPQLSREEMTAMTELGYQEGIVERGESRLLRNVLRFQDLRVNDIMTPRTVIHAAEESMTVREFFDEDPNPVFSRIPIFRENTDDMTGYVLKSDLLLEMAKDRFSTQLKEHAREIIFVPEYQSVRELFETLVAQQQHIALVVDEYGGIAGVVTMEDVVETLLGLEIVDESDVEQDMRQLARKQWLQRAKRMGIAPEDFEPPTGLGTEDSTPFAVDKRLPENSSGSDASDAAAELSRDNELDKGSPDNSDPDKD